MENEYNIPMNDEWGEEVREMCNLSQGIEEKGIRKGLKTRYRTRHYAAKTKHNIFH